MNTTPARCPMCGAFNSICILILRGGGGGDGKGLLSQNRANQHGPDAASGILKVQGYNIEGALWV